MNIILSGFGLCALIILPFYIFNVRTKKRLQKFNEKCYDIGNEMFVDVFKTSNALKAANGIIYRQVLRSFNDEATHDQTEMFMRNHISFLNNLSPGREVYTLKSFKIDANPRYYGTLSLIYRSTS